MRIIRMRFSYRILLTALSIVIMTSRALLQQRFIKVRVRSCLMSTDNDISMGVKSVGFIGLGLMGDGMARRLLTHNYPLTIWNRSKDKCDNLKADYGNLVVVADSPADVVKRSDITFLMLSTPEVTKSAYVGADGLLSSICAGKSVIDCATLAPADMMWADAEVRARGGRFVEGPVSGSKVPAEKGQLIFMLAGDQILAEEAQPYLALMGKASHFIDTEVGSATKMKLIVNGILSNMLACVAEGISITADSGLSSSVLLEVLSQGAMASPLIAMKGPKMISGDYEVNFPLKHAHKDLCFAVDLASELSSKAPMSIASKMIFEDAIKLGKGDLDFAAIFETYKK